jgi:hypothetical protein
MWRRLLLLGLALVAFGETGAEGLNAERLGVIFNSNDKSSIRIARYYTMHRHIPSANVIELPVPDRAVISRDELKQVRLLLQAQLPSSVQSLLLVWSRPYAVECMSITTAVAAGYQPAFCEPGCGITARNPLFDTPGWLPADTTGWLPAMLLPSQDEDLARAVIDRGIQSDGSRPPGTLYLVRTQDAARSARAAGYSDVEALVSRRTQVRELATPIGRPPTDIIGYGESGGVAEIELPARRARRSFDINRRGPRWLTPNVRAGVAETRRDRLLRHRIGTMQSHRKISKPRSSVQSLLAGRDAARGVLEKR